MLKQRGFDFWLLCWLIAPGIEFKPIDVIHGWIAYKVRIKCFRFILTDF